MIEWNETQLAIRDMVRRFIESEIKPRLEELEHGETPPYDALRKMFATFGLREMAKVNFEKQLERETRREEAKARGGRRRNRRGGAREDVGMRLIRSSSCRATARGWSRRSG